MKLKAQATLEYILLVSVVIGVLVGFLLYGPGSPFRDTLESMTDKTEQAINLSIERFGLPQAPTGPTHTFDWQ